MKWDRFLCEKNFLSFWSDVIHHTFILSLPVASLSLLFHCLIIYSRWTRLVQLNEFCIFPFKWYELNQFDSLFLSESEILMISWLWKNGNLIEWWKHFLTGNHFHHSIIQSHQPGIDVKVFQIGLWGFLDLDPHHCHVVVVQVAIVT